VDPLPPFLLVVGAMLVLSSVLLVNRSRQRSAERRKADQQAWRRELNRLEDEVARLEAERARLHEQLRRFQGERPRTEDGDRRPAAPAPREPLPREETDRVLVELLRELDGRLRRTPPAEG
jgi:septal ring factor EnvC (AmiA/AmiB activator)